MPSTPQSFRARYRKLLVFKSVEVEELIDMYFHRRLAAIVGAVLLPTPVTPNHVTYGSLAAGVAAAGVLAWGIWGEAPWAYPLAALLLLASVVLDCADGQIARAKGGGTRMGRIVDGMVDSVVFVAIHGVMLADVVQRWGWIWGLVALAAILSAVLQIGFYDKVKSDYMGKAKPGASDGGEKLEDVLADYEATKKTGTFGDKFAMAFYVEFVLRLQHWFAPGEGAEPSMTDEERTAFRDSARRPMRVATYLGLGTHMLFTYSAIAAAGVWPLAWPALLGLWLTAYNVLITVVWFSTRPFRA